MSLSFGTAGDAQLASGAYASGYLIDFEFVDTTVRLSTLPLTLSDSGYTYTGVGHHLQVEAIAVSEDGVPNRVKVSLSITDDAMLAATTGSVLGYRGRPITIWQQVYTPQFVAVGTRQLEWRGVMEPVRVSRKRGEAGITGRIEMPCSRVGLARSRNAQGLRISNSQQQARYPGDRIAEYLPTLTEQPYTWLSKRFQEIPL